MKNLFIGIFLLSSLCYAQNAKKTVVAVMDLRGSGISEADAKFLTDRFVIELQNTDFFDVMERDKMNEILKEQGFQQTGACDQTSCLVEAGRLLPIEKMIGGSVGKFGDIYSCQVRLIDLKTAKVEKTAVKDFSQKMEYLLTEGMNDVAWMLTGTHLSEHKVNENLTTPENDASIASIIKISDKPLFERKIIYKNTYNRRTHSFDKDSAEVWKDTTITIVSINKGQLDGIENQRHLLICRVDTLKTVIDPISKEVLKKVLEPVAELVVERADDRYSECKVINQKQKPVVSDKIYFLSQ